jgi:hypothetical protein
MFAVSAAMSVASAAAGASSDQAAYNKKIGQANQQIDAIQKSTIFTYAQNGLQQQQIENKATLQEGQARLRDDSAKGEASAAAADGGVSGNSVGALMRSFGTATGTDIAGYEADKSGQIAQSRANSKGAEMSGNNQINGIVAGLPADPSTAIMGRYFSAALGVGKSFLDNTTPATKGDTSGLFGSGGLMGIGRNFG